jgi:glycosyltransferase involved in cell wall biosynthesis
MSPQPLSHGRLRVALVGPSPRMGPGGQVTQASWLLKHWRAETSLEVRFVPVDPQLPGPMAAMEQIRGLRTLLRFPIYLADLWSAVSWADVLHIFSASYWSFLLAPAPAILLGQLRGRATLLNYHSGEARDHLANWRTALPILRRAKRIVVPSEYLADIFAEFGVAVEVIPNAVDFAAFKFRIRNPLRPRLICTRNFHPYYGLDVVLRAFSRVQQQFKDASLALIGSGREELRLRRLAEQLELRSVEFVGAIPHETVPRYLEEADILVNASRLDNQPISILEAFASGLPVASTAPEGIRRILKDGVAGLLSPVDDDAALARNVVRLLTDPMLAQRLAQQAHAEADRYRWENIRNLWLRAYSMDRDRVEEEIGGVDSRASAGPSDVIGKPKPTRAAR